MGIKYFCDKCGHEVTDANEVKGGRISSGRLGTALGAGKGKLSVEVIVSTNGVANDGLYCKYCVLDALYKLDDRPKAALSA